MTIRAFIRSTVEQEITDFLGGDPVERGEERTNTYPGVEVVYYDDTIGGPENEAAHRGICHYILRPRSSLATMDDVRYRVGLEIERLSTGESPPAPPSQASPPVDGSDLASLVGVDLTPS